MIKIFAVVSGVIGSVVAMLVMLFAFSVFLTLPTFLLWNWVGVSVLGLSHVTIIQAWGLTLLSSFLFKSNQTFKSNKTKS